MAPIKLGQDPAGLLHITLDRPTRGNALDAEMIEALHAAFDRAETEGCNGLVLSGEGRNFCTGFDLGGLDESTDGDLLHRFVRIELLLQRCYRAPFPTIAIAQGRVFGAGADLFVACDRRWARDDSMFAFPGSGFGLVLGTARLVARIGADAARDLVWSGAPIDAARATTLNLVTRAVGGTALEELLPEALGTMPDLPTFAALRPIISPGDDDVALAALVRSAVRPGLGQRILDYRQRRRPSGPMR